MIIEIENPVGVWTEHDVTLEERRAIIQKTPPEQRFVDINRDHRVMIAHPDNLWCIVTGKDFEQQ